MTKLPLFPVTMVGSWPRSVELLRAQREKRLGRLEIGEFERLAEQEISALLSEQERLGT